MPRRHRRRKRNYEPPVPVKVVKPRNRANYILRWTDPRDGSTREETTHIEGTPSNRRLAYRAADDKERELEELLDVAEGAITWDEFECRYIQEHLSGLSDRTHELWATASGHVCSIIKPHLLSDVSSSALSRMVAALRRRGTVNETSIATYLRALKAGLNWAVKVGLLKKCPAIPAVRKARGKSKQMRSRPITGEEFERMLEAAKLERPNDYQQWQRFLMALWTSGLRISEALSLSWDMTDDFVLILNGQRSMFRITAEGEKGHQDRVLPVAPEFVQFITQTFPDETKRRGNVLKLSCRSDTAGKVIAKIGRRAGVVVSQSGRTATAHDLRRSFGTRWAARLKPAQLRELMRHRSIETTMTFYVAIAAEDLASELWSHMGGILGGMAESCPEKHIAKERTTSERGRG